MSRRLEVHLEFARNIVTLSREASHEGEGSELTEMHALAVVGALHQPIYGQLHLYGPYSRLEIVDDVVQLAVGFLTVRRPPARQSPRCRANR